MIVNFTFCHDKRTHRGSIVMMKTSARAGKGERSCRGSSTNKRLRAANARTDGEIPFEKIWSSRFSHRGLRLSCAAVSGAHEDGIRVRE